VLLSMEIPCIWPASNLKAVYIPLCSRQGRLVDQWSYWQAIHLGLVMQKVAFERFMKTRFGVGETNEEAITAELKDIAEFFDVLNTGLDGKEWIAGHMSVADFALASTFMYRKPASMPHGKEPHVADWIARIENRSSWQNALEPLNALVKG